MNPACGENPNWPGAESYGYPKARKPNDDDADFPAEDAMASNSSGYRSMDGHMPPDDEGERGYSVDPMTKAGGYMATRSMNGSVEYPSYGSEEWTSAGSRSGYMPPPNQKGRQDESTGSATPHTDDHGSIQEAYVQALNNIRDGSGPSFMIASRFSNSDNGRLAMRVSEILQELREITSKTQSLLKSSFAPDQRSQALVGFVLLRQCDAESQVAVSRSFSAGNEGGASDANRDEVNKLILRRLIIDASARRFLIMKVYLRAGAAVRWISAWQQSSRDGQGAQQQRGIDERLQSDVRVLTDQKVFMDLRNRDVNSGHNLAEDPSLERILAWIRATR